MAHPRVHPVRGKMLTIRQNHRRRPTGTPLPLHVKTGTAGQAGCFLNGIAAAIAAFIPPMLGGSSRAGRTGATRAPRTAAQWSVVAASAASTPCLVMSPEVGMRKATASCRAVSIRVSARSPCSSFRMRERDTPGRGGQLLLRHTAALAYLTEAGADARIFGHTELRSGPCSNRTRPRGRVCRPGRPRGSSSWRTGRGCRSSAAPPTSLTSSASLCTCASSPGTEG